MTADERIDAIAMRLEVVAGMQIASEKAIAANEKAIAANSKAIAANAKAIANPH